MIKKKLVIMFFLLSINLNGQQKYFNLISELINENKWDSIQPILNKIDKPSLNKSEKVQYYYLKGKSSRVQQKEKEAISYFKEGLNIIGLNTRNEETFNFYYHLSSASRNLHLYPIAIDYAKECQKIGKLLQDNQLIYEGLILESNVYSQDERLTKAKEKIEESLHFISSKDTFNRATSLTNLGYILIEEGSYQLAEKKLRLALSDFEELNELHRANQVKISLGTCYLEQNKLIETERIIHDAESTAITNKFKDQLRYIYNLKLRYLSKKENIPEFERLLNQLENIEHDISDTEFQKLSVQFNSEKKDSVISNQEQVIYSTNEELSIEKLKAENRKYALFILGLLTFVSVISFLFYTKNQKVKHELQLSNEIIQKQQALENERSRIAAEMHDDLGGGLTRIKFLGQKMLRKMEDIDQKEKLQKIVSNSQSLVNNMSEIIWAMNAGFDTLQNLMAYCRRFASEYLHDHDIKLNYHSFETERTIEFSGEKRRHLFLVFKEVLHNIVKHADAKNVQVNWSLDQDIKLSIHDDGDGFLEEDILKGNGLENIRKRITLLSGHIEWQNDQGTLIEISIPLSTLQTFGESQTNN